MNPVSEDPGTVQRDPTDPTLHTKRREEMETNTPRQQRPEERVIPLWGVGRPRPVARSDGRTRAR